MPLKGKPMLSMTFWTSLGGICCRIDCSTRSQRLAFPRCAFRWAHADEA